MNDFIFYIFLLSILIAIIFIILLIKSFKRAVRIGALIGFILSIIYTGPAIFDTYIMGRPCESPGCWWPVSVFCTIIITITCSIIGKIISIIINWINKP